MSPRDIGVIIKKVKLQVERERGQLEEKDDYDTESKSKNTQAIKMFSEGKKSVDVVIGLDLRPDEVQEIYRQLLELKNMHKLAEVYDEMQNYLPSLLEMFRLIEEIPNSRIIFIILLFFFLGGSMTIGFSMGFMRGEVGRNDAYFEDIKGVGTFYLPLCHKQSDMPYLRVHIASHEVPSYYLHVS